MWRNDNDRLGASFAVAYVALQTAPQLDRAFWVPRSGVRRVSDGLALSDHRASDTVKRLAVERLDGITAPIWRQFTRLKHVAFTYYPTLQLLQWETSVVTCERVCALDIHDKHYSIRDREHEGAFIRLITFLFPAIEAWDVPRDRGPAIVPSTEAPETRHPRPLRPKRAPRSVFRMRLAQESPQVRVDALTVTRHALSFDHPYWPVSCHGRFNHPTPSVN